MNARLGRTSLLLRTFVLLAFVLSNVVAAWATMTVEIPPSTADPIGNASFVSEVASTATLSALGAFPQQASAVAMIASSAVEGVLPMIASSGAPSVPASLTMAVGTQSAMVASQPMDVPGSLASGANPVQASVPVDSAASGAAADFPAAVATFAAMSTASAAIVTTETSSTPISPLPSTASAASMPVLSVATQAVVASTSVGASIPRDLAIASEAILHKPLATSSILVVASPSISLDVAPENASVSSSPLPMKKEQVASATQIPTTSPVLPLSAPISFIPSQSARLASVLPKPVEVGAPKPASVVAVKLLATASVPLMPRLAVATQARRVSLASATPALLAGKAQALKKTPVVVASAARLLNPQVAKSSRVATATPPLAKIVPASGSMLLKQRLPSIATKLGQLRSLIHGSQPSKPAVKQNIAIGPKKAGMTRSVAAGSKTAPVGAKAAFPGVKPGSGPAGKTVSPSVPRIGTGTSSVHAAPNASATGKPVPGRSVTPASQTVRLPVAPARGFFKVPAASVSASSTVGLQAAPSAKATIAKPVKAANVAAEPVSVRPMPAPVALPTPVAETFSEIPTDVSVRPGTDKLPVDDQSAERRLNISGTKSFEMKNAKVKGDIGHFSTENFDSIPGFRLDQSLHLEIDGELSRQTKVNAVLDDKEDQDRRFTVFVDGSVWDLTIGDFPLAMKDVEFVLYNKEVRGIMAAGAVHPKWKTLFLFSQSKGMARREQFRGAGQQQEFRLLGKPVVQNSERITIDGRSLLRGTDYLIDYEEGILKFQPQLLPIEATSWIVIEYEVTDAKLAFKRNLYGGRVVYEGQPGKHLGMSVLREVDASTPKSENPASSTATPMEHTLVGVDGAWELNKTFSLSGEHSMSFYDPNSHSELSSGDRKLVDGATKIALVGKSERLDGELGIRQIGRDFKLVGREGGVAEIGERGLVKDVRKGNGRFTYRLRPKVSLFGGLEKSETNMSHDPALSSIDFLDHNVGVTWKYGARSQLETRWERQSDRETKDTPLINRDKDFGAMVWDHDFDSVFVQSKLERTAYDDSLQKASGSQVLQFQTSLGSDKNKHFAWSTGYSRLNTEDEQTPGHVRQAINNYTFDLNFDPNRVFNARGIFQWRTEKDYLTKIDQDDKVADSRFRYQPNPDLTTQFKYKVENTTKIVRDPSIDPTKYVRPPTLPLQAKDREEVVSRFENPVQKETANFSTNYRLGEKVETYFDWKRRDVRDRATRQQLSHNDRQTYELKYSPIKQIKLTGDYENGIVQNQAPVNELRDTVKRIEARNEFWEGYVVTGRWEDRDENDVYVNDNDKRTVVKGVDFARVFSPATTLEFGIARNVIDAKLPSKEWEEKAAFILTPTRKNQRYKLFFGHKSIEAARSGTHYEGGLNFSQFIGTDSILDGEIKRVSSTAGINGSGYEGTIANAKMIITF